MSRPPYEKLRESRELSNTIPFDAPVHMVFIIDGDGKKTIHECGGSGLPLENITRDYKGNGWPRFGSCRICPKPFLQTNPNGLVKGINGDVYSIHIQTEEVPAVSTS